MLHIIWNLTFRCPYNCQICAVDANNLTLLKNELSYSDKLMIVDQLSKIECTLDISGGDPLFGEENLRVVKYALKKISNERLNISTTAYKITKNKIDLLRSFKYVELTIDSADGKSPGYRPDEYSSDVLKFLRTLKENRVNIEISTVLHHLAMNKENIKRIYQILDECNVEKWHLMRFYLAGRARSFTKPSIEEYAEAIDFARSLSGKTEIVLQHGLKKLFNSDHCKVGSTLGIDPDGYIYPCIWSGRREETKKMLGFLPGGDLPAISKKLYNMQNNLCWL